MGSAQTVMYTVVPPFVQRRPIPTPWASLSVLLVVTTCEISKKATRNAMKPFSDPRLDYKVIAKPLIIKMARRHHQSTRHSLPRPLVSIIVPTNVSELFFKRRLPLSNRSCLSYIEMYMLNPTKHWRVRQTGVEIG